MVGNLKQYKESPLPTAIKNGKQVQLVEPGNELLNLVQFVHSIAISREYVFAGHVEHSTDPGTPYEPPRQGTHLFACNTYPSIHFSKYVKESGVVVDKEYLITTIISWNNTEYFIPPMLQIEHLD